MPVSAPETGIVLVSGEQRAVGLGVIGLGAFGRFCLEAYVTMPGIRVVAISYCIYNMAIAHVLRYCKKLCIHV